MKAVLVAGLAFAASYMAITGNAAVRPAPRSGASETPASLYDKQGRLLLPADYREWVFVTSGLDMNYAEAGAMPKEHVFGNVFAPRAAYRSFLEHGVWPDKTVLIVENRVGTGKGSINKSGQFQTGIINREAHVKDVARFPGALNGGWGFFIFDGEGPADLTRIAACYTCHRDHAAVDRTFVQFYPTLLPTATRLKTLSPVYLAEQPR